MIQFTFINAFWKEYKGEIEDLTITHEDMGDSYMEFEQELYRAVDNKMNKEMIELKERIKELEENNYGIWHEHGMI